MNNAEKKFIDDINSIKMNDEEKSKTERIVFSYIENNPIKPRRNLSIFPGFLFSHKAISMYSIALLVMIFGVSQVAADALPGEFLYPVKINVNEGVVKSLSITNKSKARVYADIAEERLIELEKISKISEPSQEIVDDLNTNFKEHSEKSHEYITKIKEEGDLSAANEIVSDFKTALDAHTEIIPEVKGHENTVNEVSIQNSKLTELDKSIDAQIASSTDQSDLDEIASETLENSEKKIKKLDISLKKIEDASENTVEAQETLELAKDVIEEIKDNLEKGNVKEAISLSDQINMIVNKTTTQIEVEDELLQFKKDENNSGEDLDFK